MTLMCFAMSERASISRHSRGARVRFCALPLQKREDLLYECIRRNAVLLSKDRDRAVFDELIGPTNPHYRRIDHLAVQMFHNGAAKAIMQDVILDRADKIDAPRKELECPSIERLDPTGIDECDRDAFFFQFTGCFFGHF